MRISLDASSPPFTRRGRDEVQADGDAAGQAGGGLEESRHLRVRGPVLNAGPSHGPSLAAVRGGVHGGGVHLLLHRAGRSVQVPARRAAERDEAAVTAWKEKTWPVIKDGLGPGCLAGLRR